MNLLATGGAGFIGFNFVRYVYLKRPDWHLTVYDALNYGANKENLLGLSSDRFNLANYLYPVTDITNKDYSIGKQNIAPRPANSTLDLSKLLDAGFVSTDWEDDLKTYVAKELAK